MKLVSYLTQIRQLHRLELMFKTMFKNRAQNRVENHDRNRVPNRFQKRVRKKPCSKIKNIVNKNMSFLKITDPKRETL